MSDARPTDSQPIDTRPADARTDRLHGRAAVVRVAIVLATFAVVGAIAGVVWEWVWTPPVGIVFQGEWILEPSGPDYDFSGTGWYVVIALGAGLLTAAVLGWVLVAGELTTLASAVVGSVLAGWLMFTVGHTLGPPDPRPLAAAMDDLERLPSDLRVAGDDPEQSAYSLAGSAFLAFPLGTVLGLSLVWFTTNGRRVRKVESTSAG
ncbi:hypothetical protein [Nocardioides terrigena]|uniref:hypothetical protein n=1 Tax=Nocardioides terrigena TaxID=424797 RepID=UPI000D30AEB2|nr:hypothetical protein [Nocardioides terrigena]